MNAIDFLIKEHNHVRLCLADLSNSHRETTKKKLFHTLSQELIRHEIMEHTVWYPHFKKQLSDEVQHLVSEEKEAEKAIHKLENTTSPEAWEEKFAKFKKDVEHHADEEEQKLFPEVQSLLSDEELEMIGKKMYEFKQTYPIVAQH